MPLNCNKFGIPVDLRYDKKWYTLKLSLIVELK